MAITNFIPQIWSARLTQHFFNNSVFGFNSNRVYEGDAVMGNAVKVFTLDPDSVTVKDYTRNTDIAVPETLDTSEQMINIDQEKYFNFAVDDLDAAQGRAPLIDAATMNAGAKMGQEVDTYAAGLFTAVGNSDWGLRKDNSSAKGFNLNYTSELKTFALKNNIPWGSFVSVISPDMYELLDKDILKGSYGEPFQSGRVTASQNDTDASTAQGFAGFYNGVAIWVSNQPGLITGTGNTQRHLSWNYNPIDFAMIQQVNAVEAYRPERRFADAVKGLSNFGGRVLNAGRMAEFIFDLA